MTRASGVLVFAQTKQMEVKDARVRFMSEILNGIKVLLFPPFRPSIQHTR